MPDREKVIKGWECHMEADTLGCADCPYRQGWRTCNFADTLFKDVYSLLKEQEPYISKETRLNRDEYCRVGDVLDCFDGMDMKADEVFHAVCLIEWAMSKRSVPLDQLLKEQKVKNGYWINPTSQDCHCSECGEQPVHEPGESVPLYDFCPYCGAKMEVKWNE